MVDKPLTFLYGIIEDVLIKADKLVFSVDFVVLEMDEDCEILIILGQSFLATKNTIIDVKRGNLTSVNGEEVKFNILHAIKFSRRNTIFKIMLK